MNGHSVREQQHLKHVPSMTSPAMGEHLEPNSQMELVGHSIVRAPLSLCSRARVCLCVLFSFYHSLNCTFGHLEGWSTNGGGFTYFVASTQILRVTLVCYTSAGVDLISIFRATLWGFNGIWGTGRNATWSSSPSLSLSLCLYLDLVLVSLLAYALCPLYQFMVMSLLPY